MASKGNDVDSQMNSSLDRALTLLEFISSKRGGTPLAEIVKGVDIPKSTCHRLLETLKTRGYIELEPVTDRYKIGLKSLEIGVSGLSNLEIVDVAAHYLYDISAFTGETAFLAVYNEGEIVYLYKVEGTGSIRTTAQLGSRRPVHCTGVGKAILSNFSLEEVDRILQEKGMEKHTENTITDQHLYHQELSSVRVQGWATDNEEIEVGLTCFAVPIFNYTGRVVAAMSCAGPTHRVKKRKEEIITRLKESGEQISRRLGYVESMRLNQLF
ncbi:IclR family transcriptional regulator [Peribacillus cavernae]|uniref:Glycerol operon regulatory protein n=1 Tax=Peribacillus cavernae TaxID=1674310 RepID=A0A3S0VIG6_9BACI|nr:IclR family transcriptional regulator [Peribacillus cavernae]MDQ0218155.1 DNA-binding IclR family transcriptional regulator [Peribacillus cavernae]RUQ32695.1 IclR family transcriptional regulator [Peribacillus cavernae]